MEILKNHIESLKQLCDAHHVATMYVFGSALRNDFSATSDIDFLVRFKPIAPSGYFDNYMDFKHQLEHLLGRDVDLLEEQALKNPVLINAINRDKAMVYG